MEINVAVAAFQAFVFFLVAKSETHLPIPRGTECHFRKYQKPHPKRTQIQNTI